MGNAVLDKYEAVIGLEVHAQLLTESKLFCRDNTRFGAPPNSNTCPVCLGMPGTLPVLNHRAIDFAIKAALGLGCEIHSISQFARKNYFYPDLTKGYQITQYDKPLAEHGRIVIELEDGGRKEIGVHRLHIEEDAGKMMHEGGERSRVDFNRCGVALIEIVSEPDLRSPAEAELYLQKIRTILVYLEVCDGNMEEGSLRCDANLSIRPKGSNELFTKAEVKNMNSFRGVRRALEYEIRRQVEVVEGGGEVVQETRLWDESAGVTRPMRSKEEAHDYRYFPEPDLVLLRVDADWLTRIGEALPELPDAKIKRLVADYGIPRYDATVLAAERLLADYYEKVAAAAGDNKLASNWVMGEVLRILKEKGLGISDFKVPPEQLAELLKMLKSGEVSAAAAKEVFDEMAATHKPPRQIIEGKNLSQMSGDSEIRAVALEVIRNNPKPYNQYKSGKTATFGFFVGQVMKATRGRANPQITQKVLRELLDADTLPQP
ncbi:MAG TPA: Asp-tRNA(Asn)/Glu-tRNA(Gln) amidotransferase subunit GatB [Acidobacteriota bacterium]|nr:Asp-tRNA(Asn)/Glu-tRNA(Gln) amidotransferase subunit GatB [Acidobacteriota bacterium]